MNVNVKFQIEHSISKDLERFITNLFKASNQGETDMAADLTKIKTEVEGLTDVVDSVVTMLTGLAEEVRNAGASQASLDQLASAIESQKQELADAVAANTPHVDNTLPGDLR